MPNFTPASTSVGVSGDSQLTGAITLASGSSNLTITQTNNTITADVNIAALPTNINAYRAWLDDFDAATASGSTNWNGNSSGGSASIGNPNGTISNGHPGIITLSTGSGTSGSGVIYKDVSSYFGYSLFDFEMMVLIPVLSAGSDTFKIAVGPGNTYSSTDPYIGAWFSYTDTVNSGNWTINTGNGSTTSVDSTVAVVANTWYKLRLVANTAGTSVHFYINGTSVGTISLTIPTTQSVKFGFGMEIYKTAGTTPCLLYVDYCRLIETLNTPR